MFPPVGEGTEVTGKACNAWWQGEITLVVATVLFLFSGVSVVNATSVNTRGAKQVATVKPEFISFGIDASQLYERSSGQPFDFNRSALDKLAAPLAPAFIRYSGTKVESTFYDDTNQLGPNDAPAGYKNVVDGNRSYVLSRDEWVAALEFADRNGLSVMASTSNGPGPRNLDGTWNPDNARELLERAIAEGHPPAAMMLGNEPNITYYGAGTPQPYTANDYARDVDDFLALKNELIPDSTFVGPGPFFSTGAERPLYGGTLGPDVSDIMAATGDRYDAVSYHQYPAFGDSEKCAGLTPRLPEDTLADEFLDRPKGAFEYMDSLRDLNAPGKPLWIDESGNTACGGVLGYSDRFISTFYYLNSLGYLAQNGVEVVTRWTLSGPQPYALIDDETLEPRADYWAAILWRKLMGQEVLKPTVTDPDPKLRTYSQCMPHQQFPGGTTTLLLNTSRTDSKEVAFTDDGLDQARQYVVTGDLADSKVILNGTVLEPAEDGSVPAIEGVPLQNGKVAVPAASYAFVTMPGANSTSCGGIHVDRGVQVKLTVPKQSLRKIKRTGRIKAVCRVSIVADCSVSASLTNRQARRLGLKPKKRKGVLVASTNLQQVAANRNRALTLAVKMSVLKKLRKAPPRLRPRIDMTAFASGIGIAFSDQDSTTLRLRR